MRYIPPCNAIATPTQNLLPKTGQTTSYDTGDDGDNEAGLIIATRFEAVNIGGVDLIKDNATGLIWPQDFDSLINNDNTPMTWSTALYHIAYVNGLAGYAGFTDWRMPNLYELITAHNYENSPMSFVNLFSNITNTLWTSTTNVDFSEEAFIIDFGIPALSDKANYNNFICCRNF